MIHFKHGEITEKIIGAAHTVHRSLGYGYDADVYRNALLIELEKLGLTIDRNRKLEIRYDDQVVGEYTTDVIIDELVILEIMALQEIDDSDANQLVNYLKATDIEVGLVLNFGRRVGIKRRMFENSRKAGQKKESEMDESSVEDESSSETESSADTDSLSAENKDYSSDSSDSDSPDDVIEEWENKGYDADNNF